MKLSFIGGLLFLALGCSSINAADAPAQTNAFDRVKRVCNTVRGVVDNFNGNPGKNLELLNILGALLHIPYIMTLDSADERTVRWAGILAMLPTDFKICLKAAHKPHDERFYKILLYDVPKFGCYASAATYDVINVLNAEHMILERQQKGADLKLIKKDQAMLLTFEVLLRFLAYVAAYKAESANGAPGSDLGMIASLISEAANLTELWRLIGRYQTYATMPWLDMVFYIIEVIKDIESLNTQIGCDDDFFLSPQSAVMVGDKKENLDTVSPNDAIAAA